MASRPSPERQLARFIAKYTPDIAGVAIAALAKMRVRLPGAAELVYDNYNGLAIAFGPTERSSDAIFSIVLYPRWVSLFFMRGAELTDPQKLLEGSGKSIRHVVLKDAGALDTAPVQALITQALERAPNPLDGSRANRIIIKSVSAKQRPRRPA